MKFKMKRIELNKRQIHFIGCWNLENNTLCNTIINFFENNKNLQKQGSTNEGKNLKSKKTTDIIINPKDLEKPQFQIFQQYFNELHKCYADYQNQWSFLKSSIKYIDIGQFPERCVKLGVTF